MKLLFRVILLVCFSLSSKAQNREDSIRRIQQFVSWYDLNFTPAETDSLLDNMQYYKSLYRAMHSRKLSNDAPLPFPFDPVPLGTKKTPASQRKINWMLPKAVSLPTNRNELAFYSVAQLASLLRSKKITSAALTQFYLQRLKQWDDTLEAVIALTEERAMDEARAADAEMARGLYRGPLHGIPYGLKDLFAVRGYRTTWGTTPYKNQVLDDDAYVYSQLKKAGAVLCAKLSMGALAYDNRWFGGSTKNPWNLQQGSSGSSAGSAATVAAGLLPFAIGSETLGSIMSPSTRCGVTGLRPTFGSVSRSGAMVLCWSLDKIGPITRSAEDAAMVYAAIRGTDGLDYGAVDKPFNYQPAGDIKKLRIAYAKNYFDRPGVDTQQKAVLNVFRSMGVSLTPVVFPDSALFPGGLVSLILNAESAAAFDPLTRDNRDDSIERQDKAFWPNTFRSARTIPAVEYISANRHRYTLMQAMHTFMKDWDVVIFPGAGGRQLSITNLTGHPEICVPAGFNRGAPHSITFLGNLYDEASIIAAAKAYQEKTSHHLVYPPLFRN